jgi:hypothetical protein
MTGSLQSLTHPPQFAPDFDEKGKVISVYVASLFDVRKE